MNRLLQQLFSKTVGPVKDAFIVYNSQARSKGMAVVSFQRSADAALARAKYNGKIVDGREYPVLNVTLSYFTPHPLIHHRTTN